MFSAEPLVFHYNIAAVVLILSIIRFTQQCAGSGRTPFLEEGARQVRQRQELSLLTIQRLGAMTVEGDVVRIGAKTFKLIKRHGRKWRLVC